MKIAYLVFGLLLAASLSVAPGFACERHHKASHTFNICHRQAWEETNQLSLTPEQKQTLRDKQKNFCTDNKALLESIRLKEQEIADLEKHNPADEKLTALKDSLQENQESLQEQRKAVLKAILTPDQLQKLESNAEQH